MDRTKFNKKHILVATLGFFVGFFMGLAMQFLNTIGLGIAFSIFYMTTVSHAPLILGIIKLIVIETMVMRFLISSSIFFGWLFYRKQQNKFRLSCGTTFGSFIATSLCVFILPMIKSGRVNNFWGK